MSKEKEETSWFDALGKLKKFNPVGLILTLCFMFVTVGVYNLDVSLEKKIVPLLMSFSLYLVCAFFEFYRIDKEQELKEKAWRKRVLGE